jgi:hypothetical protein
MLASELDAVRPGPGPRPLPERVTLLVLDFDGVLTDDRVWLDAQGTEWVAAHRGDGDDDLAGCSCCHAMRSPEVAASGLQRLAAYAGALYQP